jgi:arylsulfatase A-like enzyme
MAIRREKSVRELSRRQVLKYGLYGGLVAGVSSGVWLSGCGVRRRGKKPNVLLIVLDTVRADRFSCLGYERNTSVNIDALANEGVVCERAYTTDFWTLPSHASLFTGLYPSQVGATSETLQLPFSATTIAEILGKAGYDTAAFVCNPWVSAERGFGQGFDEFYEMWRSANQLQVSEQFGRAEWASLRKVLDWFERRRSKREPFFVFINFNCAHLPYQPPEPFLSRFVGNRGYNNEEVNRVAAITSMWAHLAGDLKLSERDFRIMSDLYDGEIAFADHCVGQIVDYLKGCGSLDETAVFMTSDHGENLGEHGLIDHTLSMYETTLHIPLVVRYPERFEAGTTISDFVSLVDIAPTILEICNIRSGIGELKPEEMSLACEGRLRRGFVTAENERPLTAIALMKDKYPAFDVGAIDYRMRAIRTEPYKLIWNIGGAVEMFDIQADPGELHDISGEQLEARDRLHKMLNEWMERITLAGDISFLEGRDEESMKILRSLGYVK